MSDLWLAALQADNGVISLFLLSRRGHRHLLAIGHLFLMRFQRSALRYVSQAKRQLRIELLATLQKYRALARTTAA